MSDRAAYAARMISARVTHLDGSAVAVAPLVGDRPPALRVFWESVGFSNSTQVSFALMNRLISKGPIVQTQVGHYYCLDDSGDAIFTLPYSVGALVTADNCASFSVIVSASSGGHTAVAGPLAAETARFIIPPLSSAAAGTAPERWRAYAEAVAVDGVAPGPVATDV